jgi:hypothetical protein
MEAHYNRLLVAAEIQDIARAVSGAPTARDFATVGTEAKVWRNIEQWRTAGR